MLPDESYLREPTLIDLGALRERAADDEDLLRELLGDFLAGAEPMLNEISEAASGTDASRAAHRLRGALLALCAHRAAMAAEEVEHEKTAANVDRLHIEVAAVMREMRTYLG